MDTETLSQFQTTLRQEAPNLKIAFKDQSRIQKLLGALLYPFNPTYLTEYVSTFGSTIYFTTPEFYAKAPNGNFTTIAHEFVHIYDSQRDPLFRLKYLFPQILVVVPLAVYGWLAGRHAWILAFSLVGYVVGALLAPRSRKVFVGASVFGIVATLALAIIVTKWKALALLGLVVLAPWPAPWRVEYELRGYGMTLAVTQWVRGSVPDDFKKLIVEQFTGPAYYFMSWNRPAIERTLEATRQQAQVGALQRLSPYTEVYDFLFGRRLLYQRPGS